MQHCKTALPYFSISVWWYKCKCHHDKLRHYNYDRGVVYAKISLEIIFAIISSWPFDRSVNTKEFASLRMKWSLKSEHSNSIKKYLQLHSAFCCLTYTTGKQKCYTFQCIEKSKIFCFEALKGIIALTRALSSGLSGHHIGTIFARRYFNGC